MSTQVREDLLESLAYVQDTDLLAAKNLSLTGTAKGATRALVQAEAQNVRWRDDPEDVAPTATSGQLLLAGQSFWVSITKLKQFRYIEAAVGGILNITFYK